STPRAQTVPPDSIATRVDSLRVPVPDSMVAPVDTTVMARPDQPPVVHQADALAQVVALEDKRRKAMVAGDVKPLSTIIAPDATYVHSTGIMQTRDEFLRLLANKTIQYK